MSDDIAVAGEPSIPGQRSAMARLEDLGDYLERHRELVAVPESSTTGIGRPGEGTALLRSNVVVAVGTALSRITGLLRWMAFLYVIGRGALADAYIAGNETPNIVYELLLGGVLSATLVPLFTSFLQDDDDKAQNVVFTVTLTALLAVTTAAVVAAPWIFGLYTLNVEGVDPDVLQRVGTMLTRIFLLQIFFYGVTGLANAALNARRRFFAAAWSPVLANLVVIATLSSIPRQSWAIDDVLTDDRLRWTLALGATGGIATMALVLLPALHHAGVRFRPVFDLHHPAIRRLLTMSMWTLGYVISNQIVIIVVRNLSVPGTGGLTSYFQAFTFFVLPHGLLAMSIATTFVPEMARAVGRKDRSRFISTTSLGLRIIAMLTVPAGVALFVLRRPLIGLLLQRGEFTAFDALVTSRALGGFALGLTAFSVYLFALRGFYAHQDTRTPFIINAGQCLLNIVFALLLYGRWGVLGLGAAFALSYVLAALWALRVLSYKVRGFPFRGVLESVARMAVAGALAAEATWWVARQVGENAGIGALGRLAAGTAVLVAVYATVLFILRAPELKAVQRLMAGRLRST